ncbi:hypothetical protein M758_11G135400 [Ceratodon purpureus]|uniref:ABC transporter domain-containing protein n=1 Tax=Ceratodon purpureus TaxID=3225 RepID=A0A8T0GHA2_CERPU|nr:hypothetical protein KC19_11G139200 [Ceratodon purpureus]KAG0601725.1 hypothetical protein M758_11G135400 [Ceratodon purpureus]
MELQNVKSKEAGGFVRMSMMPSPSGQHVPSRTVKSPVYFPPTPDRSGLYELSVHDLTYKVISKVRKGETREKILLNHVSADAHPSEVLAIAGPSGSSKTTFLDALAGRIDRNSLKGQILVNGRPMDSAFKRVSGYVMQDDSLHPHLTTRETLMFSARLRLPGSMKYEEKQQRVKSLIEILGLTACADTNVGDQKVRGLSGGERRRVSIGVDLIHDPGVLFLDEPTSGLDSSSALHVMQVLSQMAAQRQRTVLLTIHQPSYRILATINKFLVLAKGNVVYHGPVSGMITYFNCIERGMPAHVNVVEYALDVIQEAQDYPDGLQRLVEYQRKAYTIEENREQFTYQPSPLAMAGGMTDKEQPVFANSFVPELAILMHRELLSFLRTPAVFFIRIVLAILCSVILGTLFLHAKHDRKGVTQRQGFINFTLAFIVFTTMDAMPVFLKERQIFIRETSRGAYRTSSYVLAKPIVSLPFLFVLALIYTGTSYFLVGLVKDGTVILMYILVIFLTFSVSDAFVAFVTSLVPDMSAGQPIVSSMCAFFYLFSGLYILRTAIPKYWIWFHYLSIFKYPYEALMHNEFMHQKNVIWYNNMDSNKVLALFGLGKVRLWACIVPMICFAVAYRLFFYISLRWHTKNIRK